MIVTSVHVKQVDSCYQTKDLSCLALNKKVFFFFIFYNFECLVLCMFIIIVSYYRHDVQHKAGCISTEDGYLENRNFV